MHGYKSHILTKSEHEIKLKRSSKTQELIFQLKEDVTLGEEMGTIPFVTIYSEEGPGIDRGGKGTQRVRHNKTSCTLCNIHT